MIRKSPTAYYNSIYSQLCNFIPRYRFEKIVRPHGGKVVLQEFYCMETNSSFAVCPKLSR
ncbi:MAG: DUF4372 domain-containing protein [Lentisphaeria bacterium]|nr:DUF4372 domain-containing protein [Lentisphaeria bacterium]